jgi:hypothetical protein
MFERNSPRLLATLRLAGVVLCLFACDDSSAGANSAAKDEIEAVPFPSTIELDADGLADLDRSEDDGTVHFAKVPPALKDVRVGKILVAGVGKHTPAGLLRAVLSVEHDDDGGLTLRTAQVPIQLAYKKLHAKVARDMAIAQSNKKVGAAASPLRLPGAAGSGAESSEFGAQIGAGSFDKTQSFDYTLFDGDGDPDTDDDQIALTGEVGGGFDYELGLDVDWGGIDELPDVVTNCLKSAAKLLEGEPLDCSIDSLIPEAIVEFTVHPTVHADANVHGAAIFEFEKQVDLASTTLTPIVLGPLVLVPAVDLTAELSGGASASFTTGMHGSAVFKTSVTTSSKNPSMPKISKPELEKTDFEPNETKVTLHAQAKVGVGGRLNILLFGVTGPYATATAYGALEADALEDPCWSLHAGVDMDIGIKITSPALPLLGHVTLVDWHALDQTPFDTELASGKCAIVEDPPELPPGAGPDASHFARPTFTPWSRSYASPVEGGIAASPGNSSGFADVQRTIDGRTVRAGYGVRALTKIDDASGDAIWARQLELDGAKLDALRTAPAPDGSMVVASNAVTAPVILTRLAQDGSVIDARAFDIGLDVCTVGISSLVADGAGGYYVAGNCVGEQSFLLYASKDGDSDALWLLATDDEDDAFNVRAAATIEKDVFLSGWMNDGLDAMFALRIGPDGKLVYAKHYSGCDAAPDAIPSQVLVGAKGEVTIAGSGGAQHNGLVVRLRPDGSVGFATFPGFGFGAGSVFLLDSIAQLPTTGYVAGGSLVRFSTDGPENTPSAALVGLGADGRIQWAKRYSFTLGDGLTPSGQVGVHLTDDGGVLATALLVDPNDALGGLLWAFKAFAKDGSIDFSSGSVDAGSLAIDNLECSLTDTDLKVSAKRAEMSTRSVTIDAKDVALKQSEQTD